MLISNGKMYFLSVYDDGINAYPYYLIKSINIIGLAITAVTEFNFNLEIIPPTPNHIPIHNIYNNNNGDICLSIFSIDDTSKNIILTETSNNNIIKSEIINNQKAISNGIGAIVGYTVFIEMKNNIIECFQCASDNIFYGIKSEFYNDIESHTCNSVGISHTSMYNNLNPNVAFIYNLMYTFNNEQIYTITSMDISSYTSLILKKSLLDGMLSIVNATGYNSFILNKEVVLGTYIKEGDEYYNN